MRCCPRHRNADWTHLKLTPRAMGCLGYTLAILQDTNQWGQCTVVSSSEESLGSLPSPPHSSAAYGTILSSLCCWSLTLEFINSSTPRWWSHHSCSLADCSLVLPQFSFPPFWIHTINQKVESISRHSSEHGDSTLPFSKHSMLCPLAQISFRAWVSHIFKEVRKCCSLHILSVLFPNLRERTLD